MENGSWGDKALAHGAASAASAWLGYKLGGSFAKDIMKYSKGSPGYAIGAAAAGGAVGGSSGSILHQSVDKMYGNGTRGYDWGSIGMGALSGGAGGFAGGYTGQHWFTGSIFPAAIGGGVSSAVSGGNIIDGITLSIINAGYTKAGYQIYGRALAGDDYGKDIQGTPGGFLMRESDRTTQLILQMASDGSMPLNYVVEDLMYIYGNFNYTQYSCGDYVRDFKKQHSLGGSFKEVKYRGSRHYAIDIGGSIYGNRFNLSKQGAEFPVLVNTARELSTGAWSRGQLSKFPVSRIPQLKTSARYGSWKYVY